MNLNRLLDDHGHDYIERVTEFLVWPIAQHPRDVTYGNFGPDVHFQGLAGSRACSIQPGIAEIMAIADILIWINPYAFLVLEKPF